MYGRVVKRHSSVISVFLAVIAISVGAAHAEDDPDKGWGELTFQPWIGTLGIRFHSESLFEEDPPTPFPGGRGGASELSGQDDATVLQGLGLQGEWRPFRSGFRLNFAMYLDPFEPDDDAAFRTRKLERLGPVSGDLVSLNGFEPVSYVGLGWRTNSEGLDVNLAIRAFLAEEYSLRGDPCLNSDPPSARCGAASFGNGRSKLPGSFSRFEWYPVVSLGIEYRF